MTKKMTCIVCPIGCELSIEYNLVDGKPTDISVSGNTCKRGEKYATTELISPERTLTTTIRTNGAETPMLPVKTSKPIPKDKLFEAMKLVNANTAKLPVKTGDVIIADFICEGINLVACLDVEK